MDDRKFEFSVPTICVVSSLRVKPVEHLFSHTFLGAIILVISSIV